MAKNVDLSYTLFKKIKTKHCIDNVNNCHHDLIAFEDVWGIQWWPTRQFTFLCSIVEVNAAILQEHARKQKAELQLTFHLNLAAQMMNNQLGINLLHPQSLVLTRNKRKGVGHEKKTHPTYTGSWDNAEGT